ncbi:tetratricopeptide repeat protein [Phocaeicola plebeius]|jgi:signal transduction histidine kinase|uniref:histidine kinase n=1 Tax=Phocaeicola plebeius TaxID=310297 RepID=A0A3E4WE23_9BACT|nr:tetratricopeptide repeat protein [Phocaeicola plebeius]RGM40463.1 ATP-binding protein [Phocaeicola plebeius]RGR90130.1 ATP-binding protein [Phocaeicola plebeius]RGS09104.1 ATP-binding protein [Phocaeicola plebeius]
MKNRLFILLWCIPGFLFSVTPKPDVEKLTETADTYYQAGKVDSALWAIEQALQLAMTEKDTCAMMSCYTSQGVYLRSSGKLTEAITAYDKALQYAPLLSGNNEENLQAITTLYNNLATVYLDMKNPAQAVKYALDAVKQADKCHDKSFRTQIYTVCSSIFITQEEYEAAKTYLPKAIALSQQLQQPETELGARTYYLLTLFRTQASASEIQKLVEQTNALAAKVNSTMALVNYYQVLFYVQQTRKEWKAATQTAQKILQLPGIENYPFLQYDVYNNLHLVYKELSDFPQAYHTLELAKALSDSLFVQEKSRQLEELSVKYETQKKELEYQKLQEKRQKEKQNLQLKITFLLILMAIMAFVSLYFIQKQKLRIERQKREAEAQKREFETLQRDTERNATRAYLKELEQERNRLAKELHDGVCNDLYALEMNASTLNESWRELLRTSRENIRRVSHELLPPTFQETTLKQVLQNYAERMTSTACKVTLITLPEECDWSVLPETYCLNIYRIIQEATGNALKHASSTEIHLTLEWKLPNLELTISHNGKFSSTSEKGIGLQTMKERVMAMKGHISVEAEKIQIIIPLFL